MKVKTVYMVKTIADEYGRKYSYGIKTSNMENLLNYTNDSEHKVLDLTICTTKKEMEDTVIQWNDTYKNKNVFMY